MLLRCFLRGRVLRMLLERSSQRVVDVDVVFVGVFHLFLLKVSNNKKVYLKIQVSKIQTHNDVQ